MDMLIVKKRKEFATRNPIGHIFKTHNIIEYKSPHDGLTIDDFTKTIGYACLYKSFADTVDGIPIDEISVSLVREGYPRKLVQSMQQNGYAVTEYCNGIYYITGKMMFATQIVVTNQLDKEHKWLRVLSDNVQEDDVIRFTEASEGLITQGERNNSDAIYQISVMANYSLYEDMIRRYPHMCEALRMLMKDEFEKSINTALEQGMERGIEQGMERGMERGIEQGKVMSIIEIVRHGDLRKERGAEILGMSVEEFEALLGDGGLQSN